MNIYLNCKNVVDLKNAFLDDDITVIIASPEESAACLNSLAFDTAADPVSDLRSSTHYESHKTYDFLYINKPDLSLDGENYSTFSIFYNQKHIAIFTSDKRLTDTLNAALAKKPEKAVPVHVLYNFFAALSGNDSIALEDLEDGLTQTEVLLVEEYDIDITPSLLNVRKKLLVLKRYYEALFDLLQDMEENSGGYFTHQQLVRLRIYTNKADRLYNLVNNLREYATQVREAYQNQIDINQNKIMKLFTVITAIFLPLTLIAGWYGMNLKMPEYEYPITYAFVILVSLLIVAAMLSYFKKKKWY